MILSVLFGRVITLTVAATTKTTIGNAGNRRLTTLVNSTSTLLPIDLPPKGAEFCHTSKILLVEHHCFCALLRLYFISSAGGRSVVGRCWSAGWSTIRVAGL
jgi:hypothetical protein